MNHACQKLATTCYCIDCGAGLAIRKHPLAGQLIQAAEDCTSAS